MEVLEKRVLCEIIIGPCEVYQPHLGVDDIIIYTVAGMHSTEWPCSFKFQISIIPYIFLERKYIVHFV